jgi:hypothetical protein
LKWGCATGLTTGRISTVSDPFFYVKSAEVGDFGMRGDSGSLIVCPNSNYAIGIISSFEDANQTVRCVMLSESDI